MSRKQYFMVLVTACIGHKLLNKPDALLFGKMGCFAYIINVAIPPSSNIKWKYVEKKVNYDLTADLYLM